MTYGIDVAGGQVGLDMVAYFSGANNETKLSVNMTYLRA